MPVLLGVILLFLLLSSETAVASPNVSAADGFLKQLLGAEHYGMGGSFAGATQGANALGSNPAGCLLYTSPSPRDGLLSRMPSSA